MGDNGIFIGAASGGGNPQQLELSRANRHGLIAGATGTGKTVTLQGLVEGFSAAGVPTFVADVKGDLAGLAMPGSPTGKTHDIFKARAANLPPNARGVIITAVDHNGDAAEEGLQRGDLIVSVNNQLVTTPAQVVAAVDTARRAGRSSVLLLVKRGNAPEAFVGVDISGR